MMLSGVASPMRENSNTTTLDTMAPTNAHRAIAVIPISDEEPNTVGTITRMATVAPNAAPWEMPTVEAEASGFSSTLCSAAPASARPAPATMAHTVRGNLIDCTVFTSCGRPDAEQRTDAVYRVDLERAERQLDDSHDEAGRNHGDNT